MRKLVSVILILVLNISWINYAHSQTLVGCSQPTTSCIDATPCKAISGKTVCLAGVSPPAGGFNISKACWTYQSTYPCMQQSSDCLTLKSTPGCTENAGSPQCAIGPGGSSMVDPKWGCTTNTHTFTCVTEKGKTTTTQNCDASFAMNGLTWSASSPSASDQFLRAVVGRELQNQMGNQIAAGLSLFGGQANKCTIKLGLKNCCSGSGGGGGTNQNIAQSLGLSVAGSALKSGATYAANMGSPYVYDSLVQNGSNAMASSWANTMGVQVFDDGTRMAEGTLSGGIGAMGFGTTASAAEGLAGTIGGSSVTSSTMALTSEGWVAAGPGVNGYLYFNPYALAAAVAIMVVMSYMSCDKSDIETQALISRNLCQYVGSYCSLKIPLIGTCLETKQSYCCYNGLLAKDIEIGAHQQLGLSWGSPESPSCGGLTVDQLTSLDMSRINFGDFVNQVSGSVQNLGSDAAAIMQDTGAKKVNKLSPP